MGRAEGKLEKDKRGLGVLGKLASRPILRNGTHIEKSYQMKLKSDCICHALIDLEQQTDVGLENGKSDLIPG